ncbi:MATE family efflux transporter [Rhodopseudomonas sp. NSM]|uniref:MATE family efflux transporter n=1 Tax=Rhodopseudomonas sp. NSM TaxID=3457630 RepID=UPI0040360C41
MSDIAVAELPPVQREPPPREAEPPLPPPNPLLDGAILPTLLRLSWPNVVALTAGTCVVVAETSYIGRLGTEALAAMALVFPFVILTMTMSGGAMGGGVASAVARALGSGDSDRAATLAMHALLIGLCFGLVFTVGMLVFGARALELLGGRGEVLAQAVSYAHIFFAGAVVPWLMNTFAAILRGTGNMKLPSLMILNAAGLQIVLGGVLGLGFGPVPSFGMPGVAAGTLTAFSVGAGVMAWYIFSGRAGVTPKFKGLRIQRAMFFDILKVGAVACFTPLQSVLTITIFTHMLARFGTEILAGYGIGARLEFMLTSIAFAVGIASVPMIGMAIGAGRVARARQIAWTAALLSFLCVGVVGSAIAFFPHLWVDLFTSDPGVKLAGERYLQAAAPMYAFIGLSISLYFSAQGAARVLGPVLAQTGRLLFVGIGGWLLTANNGSAGNFFALAAASMVVLGLATALAVLLTRWAPKAVAVPDPRTLVGP